MSLVLDLLIIAHEQVKGNIYTLIFEIMEQAAVKNIFRVAVGKLHDDTLEKLAEFHEFIHGPVRHLINLSNFTVPITGFVKQQATKAVASEATFRQDESPKMPNKGKIMTTSTLSCLTPNLLKACKGYKKYMKKDKSTFYRQSNCLSRSTFRSSRHQDNHKVDKDNERPKGV